MSTAPPPVAPPIEPASTSNKETITYWTASRSRRYSFLIALPLFVLYEAMILMANEGAVQQIRVGADVWLKSILHYLGGTGFLAVGIVVLLIGAFIFWRDRHDALPIRSKYFGWMVLESTVYAVGVAFLVAYTVGALFAIAPTVQTGMAVQDTGGLASQGTFMMIALSIGAGLYEELVFRVMLVGGMAWGMGRLLHWKQPAIYTVAAVVGALLFSAVHYTGSLGDPFTMSSFMFRFLFGLVLNVIFLLRGFGIAAWTHAIYDIFVVTDLL